MTEHPIGEQLLEEIRGLQAECVDYRERIAALEAQVDECEKEIDHWKVQAHSYKPAWDQMKSENLTLEAQVKTLNEALSDSNDNARHKSKWGEYMSTDGEWEIRVQELDRTLSALTEQNINLRAQVATAYAHRDIEERNKLDYQRQLEKCEAQVAALSKPVGDLEWNRCFAFTHDPINGSIPRSGVNSLIAARLAAAQKEHVALND